MFYGDLQINYMHYVMLCYVMLCNCVMSRAVSLEPGIKKTQRYNSGYNTGPLTLVDNVQELSSWS